MNNPLLPSTQNKLINWLEDAYDIEIILAGISGSHMWRLDTESSDIDVRGVYIKPTSKVLSMHSGSDTIDAMDVLDRNIDIQFYELEKAFKMLNSNNGNLVELFLAPTIFYNESTINFKKLAENYKTKNLAPYYEGYYHSQRKRAAKNRGGKALIYTFREIYAGTVLMRTGSIIHDFHKLREIYEKNFVVSDLLKEWLPREKWNEKVQPKTMQKFRTEWEGLVKIFKREVKASSLPEGYNGYDELNDILLEQREKH